MRFPTAEVAGNPELANNLPSYLSSFVGRHTELGEVRSLAESYRLVTVTGFVGSGKTRLALQVAAELVGDGGRGVWFVGCLRSPSPSRCQGYPGGSRAARAGEQGVAGHGASGAASAVGPDHLG